MENNKPLSQQEIDNQLKQLEQEEQQAIAAVNQEHAEATKTENIDPAVIERQQKLDTMKAGLLAIIEEQKIVAADIELLRQERDILLAEQDKEDSTKNTTLVPEEEIREEPEELETTKEGGKDSSEIIKKLEDNVALSEQEIEAWDLKIKTLSKEIAIMNDTIPVEAELAQAEKLSEDIKSLQDEIAAIPTWKLWKLAKVNKLIKQLDAKREAFAWRKKKDELQEELTNAGYSKQYAQREKKSNTILLEIGLDKQQYPFAYFVAEKAVAENPQLEMGLEEFNTNACDLRWADKSKDSLLLGERGKLAYTGVNEGYFNFSGFGFLKIIKNVDEITAEGKIAAESPEARYKIIGPGGSLLADDLEYQQATQIYEQSIQEYKQKVEEEYKNTVK